MKLKQVVSAGVALPLVLAIFTRSGAVDTRQIETVRGKEVLDAQDLQIIDEFLGEAVRELVSTRDFAEIAKLRTVILSKQSSQGQYAQQFSESSLKHISAGLQRASELPEQRRFKVILNLLILVDGLQDPGLTDLAIGMLKHSHKVVRYWAVRCVTNPGLIAKLNPGGAAESQLVQRIADQLSQLVDTASPEVLALIAEFAATVRIPQGEDLLGQIVDARISRYSDWTVEYELLDGAILKLLYNKIVATSVPKPALARRFGQLYSLVMQRYIKGQDFLGDANKHYLASVLVEIEQKCVSRLLGRPQSTIKEAVEQRDYSGLLQEHNRLLGGGTGQAELTAKLNFDYGTGPDGRTRTAPLTLPEPPATRKSE